MEPTNEEIDAVLRQYDPPSIEARMWKRISDQQYQLEKSEEKAKSLAASIRWHAERSEQSAVWERRWGWLAICGWLTALLCAAGWIGGVR